MTSPIPVVKNLVYYPKPTWPRPPDSITELVLASPLCAQASNPGVLVSLSMNHLIPRGTGGGQACPKRKPSLSGKFCPGDTWQCALKTLTALVENAACEVMLAAGQALRERRATGLEPDRGTVS